MNEKKESKGIRTSIYLEKEVFNALKLLARKEGRSRSNIINKTLKELLEQEKFL